MKTMKILKKVTLLTAIAAISLALTAPSAWAQKAVVDQTHIAAIADTKPVTAAVADTKPVI